MRDRHHLMRRWSRLAAVAGLALAGAACEPSQGQQQAAPPPVTVARPLERTVTEWDEYTGRFEAVDMVEVRARVSGYLTEIHFEDGALVKTGDLLFVIDPRPFQRTLEQQSADLAAAKVRAEFATKDVERARPLLQNQTVSEQVFDQRLQAEREAEAAVQAAEARVRAAELDLEFTRVTAPINGRISRRRVSVGNYVTGASATGTLLTTIVSQDPIYFYFDVSESDYLKYTRLDLVGSLSNNHGQATPVQLALQDEETFPHRGRMDFVDNRIDEGTSTLRTRAVFDNPQAVFTSGLFARIRLAASGAYQAMMLPDEAIGTDQTNRFVYVVGEDGTVVYKRVTLGPKIDGLRVIRSGIELTDWVIVNGTQRARPGAQVTPERSEIEAQTPPPALP